MGIVSHEGTKTQRGVREPRKRATHPPRPLAESREDQVAVAMEERQEMTSRMMTQSHILQDLFKQRSLSFSPICRGRFALHIRASFLVSLCVFVALCEIILPA